MTKDNSDNNNTSKAFNTWLNAAAKFDKQSPEERLKYSIMMGK